MSSVSFLVAELQSRGIVLSLDGEHIRYRSSKNSLTDADKEILRSRREEVMAFLRARDAGRGLRNVIGRPGPLTASVAQEMWWRFGGGPNEGYPVAFNIWIVGQFRKVSAADMRKAIKDVIARHDTLRTRIRVHGETLELSLNDPDTFQVEEEDLTHLSIEAAAIAVASRVPEYCKLLNPVEGDWLGRARMFSLPGNDMVTAISFSHIVTDAGSRNIILDEIQDALGGGINVPRQAVAYNDFSLAERDYLASPHGEALIEYWRRWYVASPVMLSPIEKRPLLWGVGIRIVNNFVVPKRVLRAVQKLAMQYRVTPFVIHLTIFSLALARWSRTEHFTVRILGDKRTSLELSNTVGLMFCADPIDVYAPETANFETIMRGIVKEYEASLSLRLPTLHYYPPQAARPGIEPTDVRVKIPAVFNYYSAGTEREKAEGDLAPDLTASMSWPPEIQRMPPAVWTRPSAPVFLHLMDYGPRADASLHFFEDVVSPAEQQAFIDMLFRVYREFVPS